ncbi:MAG: quinone oxidoreductase [Candidatus Latescibacteria bacterium]|nr:quinone oxidoreductase [Candidatus Latescibacterota bacterium]
MKAIRVHAYGEPEQLRYEEVPTPKPGIGEALVKVEAVGLNYIDVYHRTGLYPGVLPFTPGLEAAGVVEAVGEGVKEVKVGDRVAYSTVPGSYAEYVTASERNLVKLPEGIDAKAGAAAMLQGMTAHYLTHATFVLKRGDTALVHAAAGGVGLLLIQMAKRCGARVLGTVSTEAKADLARKAGADEVILYTQQDFEAEVKRLTDGQGVHVVYDSVGQMTFEKSLNSLRPRGYLVLFGQSSGPVPAFDPIVLSRKGSLFVTRPTLMNYTATREELLQRAGDVLGWIASGRLKLRIDRTFPLAEAAEAHRALEGRQTTGKVLLIP